MSDSQLTQEHIEGFFKKTRDQAKHHSSDTIDHNSLTTEDMENFFRKTNPSEKQELDDSKQPSNNGLTASEMEGFFRTVNTRQEITQARTYSDCMSFDPSVASETSDYTFAALTTEIEADPTEDIIDRTSDHSDRQSEFDNDITGWPEELRWQRRSEISSPVSIKSEEDQRGFDQF